MNYEVTESRDDKTTRYDSINAAEVREAWRVGASCVIQEIELQAPKDADRSGLVHYCPFPTPQRRRDLWG